MAVIALAVAGAAVVTRVVADRSAGSSAPATDARPLSCRDVDALTAEQRQNCELTESTDPHPGRTDEEEEQEDASVRVPNLLGANYYKAIELADSLGVDLDYADHPNLSSNWIVCGQDPPAGRRLPRARFETLRVRFAPSC
jgi:hypothetical protein